MSEDPSKRTPPPISSNDPRRQTGRYGPNQNAETTKLEAAPAWAISMQESINSQFTSVNAHLDLQDSAFDGLQVRVGVLEAAAAKNRTGPQRSYSGPIQALATKQETVSQNDMKQDATLGVLVSDVAAAKADIADLKVSQAKQTGMLTDQTKMLTEVWEGGKAFIDSPAGRIIKGLLYLSLAGYAATRGIHVGP